DVNAEAVLQIIRQNVAMAKAMISHAVSTEILTFRCDCRKAAQGAILTDPNSFPKETKKSLAFLLKKPPE
ncbi:MAG: S-methyl-5'-thioadenosine phosphorylase, partial [Deltaproteobacteria bacterium]|nr:S-methyl-5'-thioadenosine phosphorylase [Deltaproteobacteria bacterium]